MDLEVLEVENFMETLVTFATTYGIKVVGAILVLIIGRIVAGAVRKGVRKALGRSDTDPAIISFAGSMAYYLVMIAVVLAALKNFGIETASLVAVLGAAGFAIGFAMQGALGNFAAGIMLLVFRPYTIGDVVDVAGVVGKVKEMKLFTTVITTPDNIRVMVPNGKIFGDTISNITAEDTRRVALGRGIGYGSDIEQAITIMSKIMADDSRVLKDPAPQIAVAELADSSVNLVVRPWANTEDYWGVKFDLTRQFKEAFDEAEIDIPYPQRVVHNIEVAKTA